jgi:hypothetical protein
VGGFLFGLFESVALPVGFDNVDSVSQACMSAMAEWHGLSRTTWNTAMNCVHDKNISAAAEILEGTGNSGHR